MIAGVVMAALLALFSINYLVNQVVLGVVLNLLAVGVTGFLFDQLVQPASADLQPRAGAGGDAHPGLSEIPFFGPVLFEQNDPGLPRRRCRSLVVWLVLFRPHGGCGCGRSGSTRGGRHGRASASGGCAGRPCWPAGVFAGLGGSFFTLASTGSFTQGVHRRQRVHRPGRVDHGPLAPGAGRADGLFFGFVTQMASQLQTLSTPMPSQFLLILPYVATIIAVAGLVGRVRPPAADGVPYEK